MSIAARLREYILQTHNKKNS